jgi:hypothetical protein
VPEPVRNGNQQQLRTPLSLPICPCVCVCVCYASSSGSATIRRVGCTSGSAEGERVSRPYLLRRLRKQGWELHHTDAREDGSLARDVLYGPGGDRRYGGSRLTIDYEGEPTPQHLTVVARDRHGWLSDEHSLCASGQLMLAVADSGVGCRGTGS